jgi:hypothetical protein
MLVKHPEYKMHRPQHRLTTSDERDQGASARHSRTWRATMGDVNQAGRPRISCRSTPDGEEVPLRLTADLQPHASEEGVYTKGDGALPKILAKST